MEVAMFKQWWDLNMLAIESQQVMWLRFFQDGRRRGGCFGRSQPDSDGESSGSDTEHAKLALGGSPTQVVAPIVERFAPTKQAYQIDAC